nr:ATP synthase subunit 8 [Haplopteris ensiformis]UQV94731.1 ATP synthase subunit 8 [Haplopteris ensiformis]
MPQFDRFTYLTQFGWLCVFYSIFYVVLYRDGLPKISRILKLREELSHDSVEWSESSIREERDVVLKECFDTSVSFLYYSFFEAYRWLHKTVKTLKTLGLPERNTSYTCSLGEISFSRVLKRGTINAFYLNKRSLECYNVFPCYTAVVAFLVMLRGQGEQSEQTGEA